MLKMILATSSKEDGYAIGKCDKLLWSCSSDMNYFKTNTVGDAVVFGYSTFNGLPFKNGLPDRTNYVLSRTPKKSYIGQDVVYFSSVEILLKTISIFDNNDTWVCGGASVYEQMLPHVQEIHHTTISGSYEDADTHINMDFLDNSEWSLYSVEKLCDKATVRVYQRKGD